MSPCNSVILHVLLGAWPKVTRDQIRDLATRPLQREEENQYALVLAILGRCGRGLCDPAAGVCVQGVQALLFPVKHL